MQAIAVRASTVEINNLKADADYEFLLKRTDGSAQSDLRLVRTSLIPA